nr:cupin domain-containing protein [Roseovarius sp. M141]
MVAPSYASLKVAISSVLSGASPERYESRSWRHFENTGKGAIAGIWQAGPHKERCKCDYDELCHILDGDVRLTDSSGQAREFGAGDSFVVAAGFDGIWENLTTVRKVFFILS